ncbi:MAG: autotransporter outer membrane beta-barrel domain-containing protein, partial [Thiothrix litoralis]
AYTETATAGSEGMELAVKEQEVESLLGSVGVRVSAPVRKSSGVFVPQASVELVREFANDPRTIEASILAAEGLSGITATPAVTTSEPDRNYAKLGVGVSALFSKGRSGFVHVDSLQGSDDISDTAVRVGYRMEF